jgi:hypothetical protein
MGYIGIMKITGIHYTFLKSIHIFESGSIFLFIMMILTGALFFLGNYQLFTDETQKILLKLLRWTSLAGLISTIYYFLLLVIWMFRRKKFLPLKITFAVSGIALAGIVLLGSNVIQAVLSSG